MKTILNLAWKELLQLWRDRLLLIFLILTPGIQLVLIAEATGSGIRGVNLAVWDQDQSQLSQDVVTALANTDEFVLAYRPQSYGELHDLVADGKVGIGLIIPPDFSRNAVRPGGRAVVPVIIDGSNVIVATTVLGIAEGAVSDVVFKLVAAQSIGPLPAGIDLQVDAAFNPTFNLRASMMPAQLAFVTYQLVLVVAAVGLVRERELGTMEQLVVTPISRLQLVLGKALMALIVGLVNFYFLVLLLTWGFKIPMHGDLTLLAALGILFIITEIGWGTLISTITTSQQQAILIVFLLAILEVCFSGYLVPTDNMPVFMRAIAQFSPLQHFTTIVRAVILKGATLPLLAGHVAALAALTLGTTTAAWVFFTRTTDF